MSELTTTPDAMPDPIEDSEAQGPSVQRPANGVSATPVLISEPEVLFSTAAAGTLQRKSRTARRHHPPRWPGYLEHSLMAREMDRL